MLLFVRQIAKFSLYALSMYVVGAIISGFVPPKYVKNSCYHPAGNGHSHTRLRAVEQVKDIDLLFLGSSHAYRGFDTRIFEKAGYRCFNLGSSSQSPIQTRYLLEKHLNRLNPKQVIYEVNPDILLIDGVESAVDLVSNEPNNKHQWHMVFSVNHIQVYNTFIHSAFRRLVQLDNNIIEPLENAQDIYANGGFVEKKARRFDTTLPDVKPSKVNNKQLTAFKDCITLIKKQQATLLLVQAPVTKAEYTSFSTRAFSDSLFSSQGKYVDFNKTSQLIDSLHFYDYQHLNQQGAEIFNNTLIEYLNSQGIIPTPL